MCRLNGHQPVAVESVRAQQFRNKTRTPDGDGAYFIFAIEVEYLFYKESGLLKTYRIF